MEKKRSIGITIFAWLFIIGGVFGILGVIKNQRFFSSEVIVSGVRTFILYLLGIVIAIATLVCGIYFLKLKPWTRQLAIGLCVYHIIMIPFSYKIGIDAINNKKALKQMIQTKYPPAMQESELKELEKMPDKMKEVWPIMVAVILVIQLAWNLIVIYFFTRPKVKEQFIEVDSEQNSGQ